jgi:hypothetical protein
MGQERGVYRNDCFNGLVEYHIYDSNQRMISRVEILSGYAGNDVEERMNDWLDSIDPLSPLGEPVISASVLQPPPSSLAA